MCINTSTKTYTNSQTIHAYICTHTLTRKKKNSSFLTYADTYTCEMSGTCLDTHTNALAKPKHRMFMHLFTAIILMLQLCNLTYLVCKPHKSCIVHGGVQFNALRNIANVKMHIPTCDVCLSCAYDTKTVEFALAAHSEGDTRAAIRSWTLIHRLQPGYILPNAVAQNVLDKRGGMSRCMRAHTFICMYVFMYVCMFI
jgi:hypothetical protein